MTRTAFFMAITATLRPVPAVATSKVSYVSSGQVEVTATVEGTANTIPIPTGSQAGDLAYVVVGTIGAPLLTLSGLAGATYVVDSSRITQALIYFLTALDIINGSLSVTVGGSNGLGSAATTVWRNVDTVTPLDVTPTYAKDVSGTAFTPVTLVAPGITPITDGCAIVYYGSAPNGGSSLPSFTGPSGFATAVDTSPTNYYQNNLVAYVVQDTANAVPDTSCTYTLTPSNATKWAASLIALRPYNPTFRLLGTLPGGTVGVAWTGTLTFAGDYTGTISIDASTGTIPAWMGTPTIDYTAKTATWSATPAAGDVGTDKFTPRATSTGGQIAVGSAQSVVVSAASASPVLVQQVVGLGQTTVDAPSITLTSAPVPGNTLFMLAQNSSTSSGTTAPTGWTQVASITGSGVTGRRSLYTRTADGTEGTTITGPNNSVGYMTVSITEWTGSVTAAFGTSGQSTGGAASVGVGPFAAPSASAVPVVTVSYMGPSPTAPLTWPAGWTGMGPLPNGSFPSRGSSIGNSAATASVIPALTLGQTSRGSGTQVYWAMVWVSKP